MSTFLKNEELDPDVVQWNEDPAMRESMRTHVCISLTHHIASIPPASEEAISMVDGSFTWESQERPELNE